MPETGIAVVKRYVWLILVLLFTGLAEAPATARVPRELLQAEPARFSGTSRRRLWKMTAPLSSRGSLQA